MSLQRSNNGWNWVLQECGAFIIQFVENWMSVRFEFKLKRNNYSLFVCNNSILYRLQSHNRRFALKGQNYLSKTANCCNEHDKNLCPNFVQIFLLDCLLILALVCFLSHFFEYLKYCIALKMKFWTADMDLSSGWQKLLPIQR